MATHRPIFKFGDIMTDNKEKITIVVDNNGETVVTGFCGSLFGARPPMKKYILKKEEPNEQIS